MAKFITDENIRLNIIVNGNKAQKELLDLEKSTKDLTRTQKDLRAEKARLIAAGKQESAEFKNVTAEIKKNNASLTVNKAKMEALQKEIGVTGLTMRQLKQRASVLRLALNNAMPNGEDSKRYNLELKAISSRLTELQLKGKTTRMSLSSIAGGFNKYAALGASAIAATTGMVLGLQKMIDYNGKLSDAQSDVQKTTGLNKKQVDELTKSFGVFSTRTSRMELLQLAEEAGRLGMTGVDNILSFVKVANELKVALGDDLGEEQIREVGKMVTVYKVGQKEGKNFEESMRALGSSINEVSASGANQASYLVDFLKRTGGISDVANIAAQDMIGLAAAFDEAGQSQEISATAINKFYGSAADDVSKFAKVAGVSITEYSRLLEEDANEALILFLKGIKKGDPSLEEMSSRLKGIELGGTRGAQAITALASNIENLENKQAIANKSLKESTSLTAEYNIKNNNLAASIEKIQKKLMGAFSSPILIGALTGMVKLVQNIISPTEKLSEKLRDQQLELYVLESRIKNVNISQEDRVKLIDKLKSQYPDHLKNINSETITNLELSKALKSVNDDLINKIILQEKDEDINEQNETIARRKIKLFKEEESLIKLIANNARDYNLNIKEGVTLEQQALDIAKQMKDANIVKLFGGSKDIGQNLTRIKNLQEIINYEEGEGNKLLTEKIDLKKRLGILDKPDVSGNSEKPKEGEEKFIGNTKFVFKGGKWEALKDTGGGGGGGGGETEMTASDKAIADSKVKLSEFIAQWNADQELQEQLLKFEKSQRAEEEEILNLENKYLKMAEDAGFETLEAARLEDIKNEEIQVVKDKWSAIRLSEKQKEDAKYKALDEKQKQALIKAEENLEAAKKNLQMVGLNTLANIFGKKTALYKLIFGLEKALAISNVIIETKKANAQIISNLAIANMKAVAMNPLVGGLPWTATNTIIAGKETLANNLNAGIQIAGIVGTAIQGFEQGLYPVEREQDGKIFNAQFGGKTQSGVVNKPTMFLAGENGPELIVDSKAFRQINPDIRNSFQREIARVKGFEQGFYPQQIKAPTSSPDDITVNSDQSNNNNAQIVEVLIRATSILDKLERDGVIAYMTDDLRNAKKIKEAIADYDALRNKNKR